MILEKEFDILDKLKELIETEEKVRDFYSDYAQLESVADQRLSDLTDTVLYVATLLRSSEYESLNSRLDEELACAKLELNSMRG